MRILKLILGMFIPHTLVLWRISLRNKRVKGKRRKAIESFTAMRNVRTDTIQPISYEKIIQSLIEYGIDENQVRDGSMPENDLKDCINIMHEHFGDQRVVGLHIGNFVGVSLVYLSDALKKMNSDNTVISVDPNIPHRGVVNPMQYILRLIQKYGLSNVSILTGYTLEKTISNDGYFYTHYDPYAFFDAEFSCANQLDNLIRISENKYLFAVIDGNHDGDYLSREIEKIGKLLCVNGLLVFDDVNRWWDDIQEVYDKMDTSIYREIFYNGRIGILKKIA